MPTLPTHESAVFPTRGRSPKRYEARLVEMARETGCCMGQGVFSFKLLLRNRTVCASGHFRVFLYPSGEPGYMP